MASDPEDPKPEEEAVEEPASTDAGDDDGALKQKAADADAEGEPEASPPVVETSGITRALTEAESEDPPPEPAPEPPPVDIAPPAPPKDKDLLWVGGLSVLLLGVLAPFLGVWEPWEAIGAGVAEAMREGGAWLKVRVPTVADQYRAVAELPFAWWPLAASTAVFGVNEIGLRVPDLVLGVPLVMLLFSVVRRLFGRTAGWFAVLALLCMPLFTFHARLALGSTGVSVALIGYSCLGFIRLGTDPSLTGRQLLLWRLLAWGGLALAGLCAGLTGLLAGFLTMVALAWARDEVEPWGAAIRRVAPPAFVVGAAALVALGWWRASIYRPDGTDLVALFVWQDLFDGTALAAKRPSFEGMVHQIGFGLFPIAAFVPLAFADLLWTPRRDDEHVAVSGVGAAAAAWFSVAFLIPALSASYSHMAIFLGAPAVAIVAGIYLARVLRSPPQPLLVVATVLMLALLDSNLKHETHYLADTLVGGAVDAFPSKLDHFNISRLLNFALLGVLILYQGGFMRWIRPIVQTVVYPPARAGWLSLWCGLGTIVVPAAVLSIARKQVAAWAAMPQWGRFAPSARRFVIFMAIWLVTYLVVRALWNWRFRRLQGRREGPLLNKVESLLAYIRPLHRGRVALLVILGGVALYQNLGLARQLTTNFSQKEMIAHYESLKDGDEQLYKYHVAAKNSSFYSRDLEALDARKFADLARGEARFFAIVPRDRLATINTEFHRAAKRNLPVLDSESSRFLLVSNKLAEGEEDKNPIEHARVKDGKLPASAKPVSINFDDTIALEGWELNPAEPRPGSPLEITMYWRAKKRVSGRWKVFVHIDAAGQRIHGDHDPVEGLYPTSDWAPGDLIRDTHKIVVKRTTTSGRYTFYAGLYQGSKRMEIKAGAKDGENRARLGTVIVR